MRIVRSPSKEHLALDAALAGANRIRDALHKKGEAVIVLATGMSQVAMLSHLVQENLDWSRVTAFHLDEYIGIRATHPASFRRYLQQRVLSKVKFKKFHPIQGEKDPLPECKRLNKLIEAVEVDVAFVGIGENGHLAFNDPPADVRTEQPYIVVGLDKACRKQQLGEGWFKILEEVPRLAISMSIRQILKAESIICTVPDARKAKAVQAALEGEISPHVPASYLQQHRGATIFVDPASGSLLGPSREPVILELERLEDYRYRADRDHYFHLFIAADFTKIPGGFLTAFARKALDSGAATATIWGKGASAMELAFDQEDSARALRLTHQDVTDDNVVLTSSFKPDDLDRALFYFLDVVKPARVYEPTCTSAVAVLVGTYARKDHLLESLAHPGDFIDGYVAEEDEEPQ
jgi:glucosamine-6-phosphate deaminase